MREWIKDLVLAAVIVIAVLVFVKPTIVSGSSMEPPMQDHNFLLVSRQAYTFGDEQRGDIIVFKSDLLDEKGKKKLLVKRIIGLPGDSITIKDGSVAVNGTQLQEKYTQQDQTQGELSDYLVPDNALFVLGDNRDVSLDSRFSEVGCVNEEKVVGKVFLRLYPFHEIGGLN